MSISVNDYPPVIRLHFDNLSSKKLYYHCVDYWLSSDAPSDEHNHDFFEFFLVTSGKFIHCFFGRPSVLGPGTLCLLHPENIHYFKKDPACPAAHLINIAFSKEIFQEAFGFLGNIFLDLRKDRFLYKEIAEKKTWMLLLSQCQELLDYFPNDTFYQQALLKQTLIDVMMTLREDKALSERTIPLWLLKATQEMHKMENFVEGLKRFIKIAGKSQEHLSRMCQRYFSQSPTEYINKIRLKYAVNELTSTQKAVIDIAYDAGFNNLAYFYRLFKRLYQQSPLVYRRRAQAVFYSR